MEEKQECALRGRTRPEQHVCAGSTCSKSAKSIWSEICVGQDPMLPGYTANWTISYSLQGLLSAQFYFEPPLLLPDAVANTTKELGLTQYTTRTSCPKLDTDEASECFGMRNHLAKHQICWGFLSVYKKDQSYLSSDSMSTLSKFRGNTFHRHWQSIVLAFQALLRRIPDSDSTHFQMEALPTVQNRFPYFNSHSGVKDHHHTEEVVKIQKYSTTYLKPLQHYGLESRSILWFLRHALKKCWAQIWFMA